MQLQEGKYYEAEDESIHGPMSWDEKQSIFKSKSGFWIKDGRRLRDDYSRKHPMDLLHEVEKPKRIEPTYEERQAAWLAEHGLKVGDKVKVVKREDVEGAAFSVKDMENHIGQVGDICDIGRNGIQVNIKNLPVRRWPYTSLEPYKEPQYRPFTFEEAKTELYKKDVVHKESGSFGMAFCLYLGSDSHAQYTTQWWFDNYTFPDGAPCGKLI